MSTQKSIDPEVHAILAEVVADSSSTFFGRPQIRIPQRNDSPLSARDATLSRAERKLISVYRQELAHLLLEVVQRRIVNGMTEQRMLLRYAEPGWVLENHSTPSNWMQRAGSFLKTPFEDQFLRDPSNRLALAIWGVDSPLVSTCSLARTSLRLVPRDTTQIYLGLALFQEGQPQGAIAALEQVLAGNPSPFTRSLALQNLGMVMGRSQNTRGGMLANRESALVSNGRGDPAMNWFADALFAADADQAELAASVIADRLSTNHPSIDEFLNLQRFSLAGLVDRNDSTDTFRSTFHEIENRASEPARRIGNALLGV